MIEKLAEGFALSPKRGTMSSTPPIVEVIRQPLQSPSAGRPDLRRIVVEALVQDPVIAPDLQRQLVQLACLAIRAGHLEHPVDDDAIAIDQKSLDAARTHLLQPGKNGPLVLDKRVPAHARRQSVLLHGSVRVVEILDRLDVLALLDESDELTNAIARGHDGVCFQVAGATLLAGHADELDSFRQKRV